jgi:hypothetical protein
MMPTVSISTRDCLLKMNLHVVLSNMLGMAGIVVALNENDAPAIRGAISVSVYDFVGTSDVDVGSGNEACGSNPKTVLQRSPVQMVYDASRVFLLVQRLNQHSCP